MKWKHALDEGLGAVKKGIEVLSHGESFVGDRQGSCSYAYINDSLVKARLPPYSEIPRECLQGGPQICKTF